MALSRPVLGLDISNGGGVLRQSWMLLHVCICILYMPSPVRDYLLVLNQLESPVPLRFHPPLSAVVSPCPRTVYATWPNSEVKRSGLCHTLRTSGNFHISNPRYSKLIVFIPYGADGDNFTTLVRLATGRCSCSGDGQDLAVRVLDLFSFVHD